MRYAWIEQHRDDYAVSRMCRLLAVSRTGFLQWRRRPPSARAQANARLDAQVAALHAASKSSYGRPRIVHGLRAQGLQVGHERVRRSLQRQALRPVYKRPYRVTTDSNHRQPVASNALARQFDGWAINRAWVCDITYVGTGEGWLRKLPRQVDSSKLEFHRGNALGIALGAGCPARRADGSRCSAPATRW